MVKFLWRAGLSAAVVQWPWRSLGTWELNIEVHFWLVLHTPGHQEVKLGVGVIFISAVW